MSNLTDLVPPLELCKLIPDGKFEDSVHWYRWSWIDQKYLLDRGKPDVRLYREPCPCGMKYLYPAPTLQEIMEELIILSPFAIKICKSFNEWDIECCIAVGYEERYFSAYSVKNPATAALRLWLRPKGIPA